MCYKLISESTLIARPDGWRPCFGETGQWTMITSHGSTRTIYKDLLSINAFKSLLNLICGVCLNRGLYQLTNHLPFMHEIPNFQTFFSAMIFSSQLPRDGSSQAISAKGDLADDGY